MRLVGSVDCSVQAEFWVQRYKLLGDDRQELPEDLFQHLLGTVASQLAVVQRNRSWMAARRGRQQSSRAWAGALGRNGLPRFPFGP
jgi:hypothetical protein